MNKRTSINSLTSAQPTSAQPTSAQPTEFEQNCAAA
jgi:hypothetical protein